jgi:predicted nucleic acid-binding protein
MSEGEEVAPGLARLVVDASVAMKLFVMEEDSERALTLFRRARGFPPAQFFAPDLLCIECTNALWKQVRRFDYPAERAARAIKYLLDLPFVVCPTSDLAGESLDLAVEKDISAYDACYVALSRRVGAPLVTADERLVRKFAGGPYDVRRLGDVGGGPEAKA